MSRAVTVRTGALGGRQLRLVAWQGLHHGLVDGQKLVNGEDPDDVWRRLHDEVARSSPAFFGFEGARRRFLGFFPNGFHSDGFLEVERDYKLAAKAALDDAAPLASALAGEGACEEAARAFGRTNLLSHFETMRAREALAGPEGAAVLAAAAAFAEAPRQDTLGALAALLKPYKADKWTIATYLPFLWRPDAHMFLKPVTTVEFAERVGHPFQFVYGPRLDFAVYEALLDLAETAREELADLRPRDMIDIQSFIWTVGNFVEGKDGPYP